MDDWNMEILRRNRSCSSATWYGRHEPKTPAATGKWLTPEFLVIAGDSEAAEPPRRKSRLMVRTLWSRLVRAKRRILSFATAPPPPYRASYDPSGYAQNFDEGPAMSDEPENLVRSFSARYANPTRVLPFV